MRHGSSATAFIIPSAPCKIKRFFAFSAKSAAFPSAQRENRTVNVEPLPTSLSTPIHQPAFLHSFLTTESPSPKPPFLPLCDLSTVKKAVEDALSVLFGDADARILHGELRLGEATVRLPPSRL